MAQAAPADSAAIRSRQWLFRSVLVGSGLLQLALFAYATAPGLAGTGDSRLYLYAARTLRATGHLLHPDGTPYRYWPPLYPVLLGAAGSLAGIRGLHAASLLGSLLLWSWLGRQLLPARRALVLPALLALSTPWLLVGKFVWSESVFLLLFAAYAGALFQWLRTGRWGWWAVVTLVGLLLPLHRTLSLFLLLGVGVGLLLGEWPRLLPRHRWRLLLHLVLSAAGGLLWQWYALLMAGPSRYHPSRGGGQLLSSAADYGFVLSRWLLPLPATGRVLLPAAGWALVLAGLFWLLWPRSANAAALNTDPVEPTASAATDAGESKKNFATAAENPAERFRTLPAHLLLRTLWSTALALVGLVAVLTVFAQSAASVQDAERYASVLFASVVLLVLAAWPPRAPRWLGQVLVAGWLLGAALRVAHVAADLRRLPPIAAGLFTTPMPHGQRVGAAGE